MSASTLSGSAPVVDGRDRSGVLADLLAHAPGYTPGWAAVPGSAGLALAEVIARYAEILIQGLNQVPDRSFLAFLSSIGVSLLPAQPARAPLVFTLMETSPLDVFLPANSQAAAVLAPPPPSPLVDEAQASAGEAGSSVVFSTTQAITLTRARLAELYSLDPSFDQTSDHTPLAQAGFTLFADPQPNEHALYLGHDALFALAGEADIYLSITPGAGSPQAGGLKLAIDWEYLSQASAGDGPGWLPLEIVEDRTQKLTQGGEIVLRKSCGPDAKQEVVGGQTSYWLRGVLRTPLPAQASQSALPLIDTIQARVGFTKADLNPEAAFTDSFQLDTGNNFYPFGRQPVRYTTFYIASEEAFQRRQARINLIFRFSEPGEAGSVETLALAWEYYDGHTWQNLGSGFDFTDGTAGFTKGGTVSFLCPLDWQKTKVNGQENYWLRVRIETGDYGHPLQLSVTSDGAETTVEALESTLQPPVISSLQIDYTYQTEAEPLDHCLTFNDFAFRDDTHACQWQRQSFAPFRAGSDTQPAVYFGFDRRLPSGLISLFLHVEPSAEEGEQSAPTFVWEYLSERGWTELSVLDETGGFMHSGMIQFIGPPDALLQDGLYGPLYRIRARLKQGEPLPEFTASQAWLNGVWGIQRQAYENEVLGTSDGNPGQTFSFLRREGPVLESETVEVREWTGRGEDWQTAVQDVDPQDLRFEYDPVTHQPLAVWVRWRQAQFFYGCGPDERCYVIERSSGILRFGDGQQGLVPPAGSRIAATYNSGGGVAGNVAAGAISELRTGVPYLMGVANPAPADGGAATEWLSAVKPRGAQQARHRGRAASAEDYEWLALQASPGVARARALPLRGPNGDGQPGWVSLVLVPNSQDPRPAPSAELKRRVGQALQAAAPATARLRILDPEFVPVRVIAELTPLTPGEAAEVDARLRQRLNDFLHPLRGGLSGEGWAFGQPVYRSQVARLVEETVGVDFAAQIVLQVGDQLFGDSVPVGPYALVCAGDHELKLTLRKG
jgi:hypothetical protein